MLANTTSVLSGNTFQMIAVTTGKAQLTLANSFKDSTQRERNLFTTKISMHTFNINSAKLKGMIDWCSTWACSLGRGAAISGN